MSTRFALARGRALTLAIATLMALAWVPALAQPAPQASLEPLKLELGQIEATLGRESLGDDDLAELRDRVTAVRDEIRSRIEAIEPQLTDTDARRKQLGDAPEAGAPREDPAIAAERERLDKSHGELDAALKQLKLLSLRADQLSDRITNRRRALFTQRMFKRTPSALQLSFWQDVAEAASREVRGLGFLVESWWRSAYATGGVSGIILAGATLIALAIAGTVFVRWWRRRAFVPRANTRFTKAVAALVSTFQVGLTAPLCTAAVLLVFDACGLLPPRIWEIGKGLVAAVAVASFGHGVVAGLLAPGEPARRLVPVDDTTARRLAKHFAWAARVFGATIFLNVIHQAVVAPVSLTVATSALFAIIVVAIVAYTLLRVNEAGDESSAAAIPRAQWLRAAAWLVVAAILVSLALGYIGFAAFLAGRLLMVVAVLAALYICLVFTDALFTEVITGDTPRGRAIAATFGIGPRGVELIGTILSALLRIVLVLIAFIPLLSHSGILAGDVFGTVQGVMFGFRIGDITISLTAVLGAFAVLLIGVLATRATQRWLQTRFLPRTGLESSLQLSVSTIIGYVGVIAALTFALAELGIDVQKIALIAGALSVGIGFGLQSIVSNFVSGLILLAERPIRVGDSIVVKGEEGYVRRISVRATEIETFDRASVIVPNSELITGVVKNWTHGNPSGRIICKIGVSYGSDAEQVRDILLACASDHPLVLRTPPPRAYLVAFGDSALQFELRCVVAHVDNGMPVKSDIHFEILRRFRAAGIEIPYPRQEVRLPGNGGAGSRATLRDEAKPERA
jgi:potassium-dependent mechanosensitive channel